jgi:ABC-2 type transport system permease protein
MMLRKYWATAALSATSIAAESPLFLADYVLRFVRVAVLLTLWRIILGDRGSASGMSLAAVLTYTLVAQAFADQLAPRSAIADAMWTGSFANHFSRPMGIVGQFVSEMVGRWTFGLAFFAVPLLLCAPLFGVDPRPADPLHGALFVASLALGVSVGLALDFIFGALTVMLDMGPWVIERLRHAVGTLLSGALLPLALLPWGLGAVFQWLPFAALASAPLRIYTGTGDPLPLMGSQVLWTAALWPLAQLLWSVNRERLSTYGG